MNITLVSYDNWKLNKYLEDSLKTKGHTVHHIDICTFIYKYPSFIYKIYNFFLKTFIKKNLKTIYYGNEIIKRLQEIEKKQDIILTIKGDFIHPKSLLEFKNYTNKSIAFFNDSSSRCPKIKRVLHCFDDVYSFEKKDCEKYNLKFIPNWVYTNKTKEDNLFEFQVFNISSKDNRVPIISKIAKNLKEKGIKYKIIVFHKKNKISDPNLEFISKPLTLTEVEIFTNQSKVLLDINRKGQKGLSFRVFESMGLEKKLISTNEDLKNYDFYNPKNILIIDEKKPIIPLDFFKNEYEKIPEVILKKYTLEEWSNQIFN
jgi:hypothetical protein